MKTARLQFRLIHLLALVLLAALVFRFPWAAAYFVLLAMSLVPLFLYTRWIDRYRVQNKTRLHPLYFSAPAVAGFFVVFGLGIFTAMCLLIGIVASFEWLIRVHH